MGLTDAQRLERNAYIGGSDAPALAGVNPPGWAQPIDVYLDKVGQGRPRQESRLMGLGTLMEDLVFSLATEATGITWRRYNRPVRSTTYPWAGGHVDRYGTDPAGTPVVGEGKWSMRADGWGPTWTVDAETGQYVAPAATLVPLHYAVQVQHYLAVTGRPAAVVAALLGYADFRWYVLPRNDAMIARLMEIEERFWRDNVLAGVPPAPDGSASYGRHLRQRFAADDGSEAVATPEQQALVAALQLSRANLAAAVEVDAKATQAVQLSMGSLARLVGPGWQVTWRQNKPSTEVQWEAWMTALLAAEHGEQWPTTKRAQADLVRATVLAGGFAKEKPGSRAFIAEFDVPKEDAPDAV